MKLLHVDSSVLGDNSVSRHLTAAIVAEYRRRVPDVEVIERDLAADPLSHISPSLIQAQRNLAPTAHTPELEHDLAASTAALEEFMASDVVVVGAPMYNFTVPSTLKAWIDRLCVAGRTFNYGPDGVKGLAGGRKVVIASARGGLYGPGTSYEALDHQEAYLKSVFSFLGITDIEVVRAEGVAVGGDQRQAAIDGAERQVAALKAV